MKTFREFVEKRFLIEAGIGAPGALPPGPGGPPGGGMPPPPPGGGMGGPPGGLGGPPPGIGGPPGGGMGGPGGDMTGKKPLELKPLNVWEVLEKILGVDEEEPSPPKEKTQPKQMQHLQG